MSLKPTRYPRQGRDELAFEVEGTSLPAARPIAHAQVLIDESGSPMGVSDNPIAAELHDAAGDPIGVAANPLSAVISAPIAAELQDAAGDPIGVAANPLVTTLSGSNRSPLVTEDAWGRPLQVAPFSLASLRWTYEIGDRSRATEVGTGAVLSRDGALILSVAADEDRATLRSKQHPAYQANRGHVFSTATQGVPVDPNVVTRIGLWSSRYGVFFLLTSTGIFGVVRNTTGNTAPGDFSQGGGTTTDLVLDLTAATLAALDVETVADVLSLNRLWDFRFQWRGAGDFAFFVDQKPVGTIERLGKVKALTIAVPSQPVRLEVEAIGAPAETVEASFGCVDVSSEGGTQPSTRSVVAQRDATGLSITTETTWLAVKVAPNIGGLGHTHDVHPARFTASANNETIVRVYRNPTLSGGTWSAIPGGDGGVLQREPTGFTGGDLVAVGTLSDNDADPTSLPLSLTGIGVITPDEDASDLDAADDDGDVLLITLQSTGGTTTEVASALILAEEV